MKTPTTKSEIEMMLGRPAWLPTGRHVVFERGLSAIRQSRHNYLLEGAECALLAFFWVIALTLAILIFAALKFQRLSFQIFSFSK